MDEEMMQMMAMEQMLAGDPSGGMGGGGEAPPGYTMVYVPDSVLPSVMELVDMAEGGGDPGMGMGMDPSMGMGGAPMGMDPGMGAPPMF
jgi:hypothetical protein